MPFKQPLPSTLIRHRGFFNYEDLLKDIRAWFADEEYVFQIPSYTKKFPEPTGTEHQLKMKGEKKVTGYVKFNLDIVLRVYNMRDIEIIQEGKKLQVQDGQIMVQISPTLELDWQNRFTGPEPWKKFLEGLDVFFRTYIIRYKIADYWEDMIMLKGTQLAKAVKTSLGQEIV